VETTHDRGEGRAARDRVAAAADDRLCDGCRRDLVLVAADDRAVSAATDAFEAAADNRAGGAVAGDGVVCAAGDDVVAIHGADAMLSPTEDGLGVAARNPVLATASDDSVRRCSIKTPVLGDDRAGQSVVDIVVAAGDRRVAGGAGEV